MISLDVSAFEIPTQSMESFDEQCDDSGQQLMLIENDQDVDDGVASTPAHSSNKVETKSDPKSGTNLKSWVDMAEKERQVSPLQCVAS